MRTSIRFLTGALCTGLLVSLAGANTTPLNGTLGTEFTTQFAEDVGPKPKLLLQFLEPAKKARNPKAKAKVLSSDGTNVTFVIQAVKGAGSFDVVDKKTKAFGGTISMTSPRVDSTGSETVSAGGELTINGQFFGGSTKKKFGPKVFVNGKKAKLLSYTDTSVTVRLSKKTPTGFAEIRVLTKVGEGTLNSNTIVTAPPVPIKGPNTLSTKINGKTFSVKFTKKTPEAVVTIFNAPIGTMQITVAKNSGSTRNRRTQLFNIAFQTGVNDLNNLQFPATFTDIGLVTYQDSKTKIGNGIPPSVDITSTLWTNDGGATPFSVTIDNFSDGRMSGSFSGTLTLDTGNGPATVQFTNSKFVTDVEQ